MSFKTYLLIISIFLAQNSYADAYSDEVLRKNLLARPPKVSIQKVYLDGAEGGMLIKSECVEMGCWAAAKIMNTPAGTWSTEYYPRIKSFESVWGSINHETACNIFMTDGGRMAQCRDGTSAKPGTCRQFGAYTCKRKIETYGSFEKSVAKAKDKAIAEMKEEANIKDEIIEELSEDVEDLKEAVRKLLEEKKCE